MSMKPDKKSDQGKAWMKPRRNRTRMIQPEYHLIVTEGTKTEPEYFSGMQSRINKAFPNRIILDINGIGDNTLNLFEAATTIVKASPNGYKHVWIVYDKDDFQPQNFNLMPVLCASASTEKTAYHAVWSNECIELWFLLHFEFLQSNLHRSAYFPKLNAHLQKLGKGTYQKNRKDMFAILEPYMDDAVKNACKLEGINAGRTPSDSAPGTMVHKIIQDLKPYL